jgi:hypothetical protein
MRLSQVRTAIDDAIVAILVALLELRIRNPKVLRTQIRRWSITPAIDVLMVLHAGVTAHRY